MPRDVKKELKTIGPHWVAGNTPLNVGSYTSIKPKVNLRQCTACLLCFAYCPDGAISITEDSKGVRVDFNLCKACGICAHECPKKAIKMISIEKL